MEGGSEMQLTESKIKEFVQHCYDDKGYNKQSLINDIQLQLQRGWHSPVEGEILPHVLNYLQNN